MDERIQTEGNVLLPLLSFPLTLSVMSLSASSRMSRVRSLMVSRVMELFWRRCLRIGEGHFHSPVPGVAQHYDKWLPLSAKHHFFSLNKKTIMPETRSRCGSGLSLPCHFLAGQPLAGAERGNNITGTMVRKRERDKRKETLSPATRPNHPPIPLPHTTAHTERGMSG